MPNEESRPTVVVQTRSIDRVERSWDAGLEGRSIKARSVDGVEGCALTVRTSTRMAARKTMQSAKRDARSLVRVIGQP